MPEQPEANPTNWRLKGSWIQVEVYALENYTKPNLHLQAESIQERLFNFHYSPRWEEELSGKPTQRTDGKDGNVCGTRGRGKHG